MPTPFKEDKQEPYEWEFGKGYGVTAHYEAPLTRRIAYDGSGRESYIGKAIPGSATSAAVWQVQSITYDSNGVASVIWADGDTQFDNIWDNRAALSYS